MAELQIRLYSAGASGAVEGLEQSLTGIRDKLDILEEQGEALMAYWEGPAGRQWNSELGTLLNGVREYLEGLIKLTEAVNEIAVLLAETEKSNESLVNQLY